MCPAEPSQAICKGTNTNVNDEKPFGLDCGLNLVLECALRDYPKCSLECSCNKYGGKWSYKPGVFCQQVPVIGTKDCCVSVYLSRISVCVWGWGGGGWYENRVG